MLQGFQGSWAQKVSKDGTKEMMWHNAVVRHPDGSLAVHEHYVLSDGARLITVEPMTIAGFDNVEDLQGFVDLIQSDLKKYPEILNYEDF